MALICPAAILSVLLNVLPCKCVSIRSEINFNRGIINTFITSPPNSERPAIAPYNDER